MRAASGESDEALHAGSDNVSRRWDREERRRRASLEIESPVEVEYTNPNDLLKLMMKSGVDHEDMDMPGSDASDPLLREETRRKPIISIHGRDVDEDEIEKAA
jgi:hypothetical protein